MENPPVVELVERKWADHDHHHGMVEDAKEACPDWKKMAEQGIVMSSSVVMKQEPKFDYDHDRWSWR